MIQINEAACTGCGRCVRDCMASHLELRAGKAHTRPDEARPIGSRPGGCLLCGHCVAVCPAKAVSIPGYDMADVEDLSPADAALDPARLLRAIKFRRSVRDYRPEPVAQAHLDLLVQAGRYTATAGNAQGCRFLFVQRELEAFQALIWDGLGRLLEAADPAAEPFRGFYLAHRADPRQDFLFRNAPAALFIASPAVLDAGLAAQNMELLGVSLGLGFLFNRYLQRAAELLPEALAFLGAGDKPLAACALLGYPAVTYLRTAPRRPADVRSR